MVIPDHQDPKELESSINRIKEKYLGLEEIKRIDYRLQPLHEIHTETRYGSSPGKSYVLGKGIINGLVVLAVFLWLIGCVNFVNLATAQSLKQSKEVGVRKVLGSNRSQLFFQFISETLLLVLLAFAISVFVSDWSIQQINKATSFVKFNFVLDQNFVIMAGSLIALITLMAGAYPAIIISKFSPAQALKNSIGLKKTGSFPIRQLLIVLQFCVAQLLIAGTVIVAIQMEFIRSKDLGYNKENIVNLHIPESDPEKMEAFRQKLLQFPQINHVSFSSGPPTAFGRQYGTTFRQSHEPLDKRRKAEMKVLDTEYIDVYKLKMIAGNWIGVANKTEEFNGIVVNEALVKGLGLSAEEAIGEIIIINEGEAPIIGVVRDFHNNALQEEISSCVFLYWGTGFLDQASILLIQNNGQDMTSSINLIEEHWKQVYPEAIFKAGFLEENLAQNYIIEDMMYKTARIASGIAIFIACLGLYGLIYLVALQRTKELGIRKVLGASVANIMQLLSWDLVKLVGLAVLLATPLVWYLMQQWLQEFAYRIALEWWYFFGAGILTMIIALLTVSIQSIKSALHNPVNSLINE